jgi:hypothetical protein
MIRLRWHCGSSLALLWLAFSGCTTHLAYQYHPVTGRADPDVLLVKKIDVRSRWIDGSEHRVAGAWRVDLTARTAEYLPGHDPACAWRTVYSEGGRAIRVSEGEGVVMEGESGEFHPVGPRGRATLGLIAIAGEAGKEVVFVVEERRDDPAVARILRIDLASGEQNGQLEVRLEAFGAETWVEDLSAGSPSIAVLIVGCEEGRRTLVLDFKVGEIEGFYEGAYYPVGDLLLSPEIVSPPHLLSQRLNAIRDGEPAVIELPSMGDAASGVQLLSEVGCIFVRYQGLETCALLDSTGEVIEVFGER